MSPELILTLLFIGFTGSLISGMLGIGGAVINYPLLLYVPPALRVASYTAHQVSGMMAMQVFFATLSGVLALRKEKLIHHKLVAHMGISILAGSFAGGYGGRFLSGTAINLVYAVLATIAAVMMLIPTQANEDVPLEQVKFNRAVAVAAALLVGTASGIVGAGGAFLLVPIMLQILKIPTRITIASSLAITFLSAVGSGIGKIVSGDVLFGPSLLIVIASVIAGPLGAKISKRTNAKVLHAILAVLILGATIKIWIDLLL